MNTLLQQAEQVLDGRLLVASHRERAACWLARAAFEQIVADLLIQAGHDPGEATMRTQLSCLEAAYLNDRPGLANQAEYAWAALSCAAHEHAFELSPTESEVRHLLTVVRKLQDGGVYATSGR